MMRPFLCTFIQTIDEFFNIYVYSLGSINYIDKILNAITFIIDKNPFKKIIANPINGQQFHKKNISNLDIGFSNILIIDDRSDVWNFDKHLLYKIIPYNSVFNHIYQIDTYTHTETNTNTNTNTNTKTNTNTYKQKTSHRINKFPMFNKIIFENSIYETDSENSLSTDTLSADSLSGDILYEESESETDSEETDSTYSSEPKTEPKTEPINSPKTEPKTDLINSPDIIIKKYIKSTDIELLKLVNLIKKYYSLYPKDSFNIFQFRNLILKNDYGLIT